MKEINLRDLSVLKKKDFNNTIKVIPTYLLEALKQTKLPIKNLKIAVSNICDFLTYLNIQFDKYGTSLLPIDLTVFEKYFNHKAYPAYKQILKELGVITQVSYESGIGYSKEAGISKQYRIHNDYLNADDYTLLVFNNKKEMIVDVKYQGEVKMLNTITNEALDYNRVFTEELSYHTTNETSKFSLYIRLTKALSITSERFIKQGSKSDRIYHSFSNLSRITRKCFETHFYNIDLKNSQPTMLVLYMKLNNILFDSQYQIDCEDGNFYEQFYDIRNVEDYIDEDAHRNEIKRSIYKNVFFGFNPVSLFNKRFKALYPMTWDLLNRMNEWTESVASILQNTEADLFNNLKVKTSSRYYTLFDAIYYNNKKDIEDISKQILKYGEDRGVKFTLKYE